MSTVLGRTPAPAAAGAPAGVVGAVRARGRGERVESLVLRLVAFAALAGLRDGALGDARRGCSGRPRAARGARCHRRRRSLALVGRASLPRPAIHALAALIALVTLVLGLVAAGLPARLLLPAHWSELTDGLDRGLAGVEGVVWPYGGGGLDPADGPARRPGAPHDRRDARVLAGPAGHGSAARGRADRCCCCTAARWPSTIPASRPRGLVLLVLVGAWLWLPRLPRREALLAAAPSRWAWACCRSGHGARRQPSLVGLPRLELVRRRQGHHVRLDHPYGPLDWSRAGATVLNVKSDRPHYWKAETLDGSTACAGALRRPRRHALRHQVAWTERRVEGRWDYNEYNPAWDERLRFTVRSLSTPFVVGAGVVLDVDGVPARLASDGTTRLIGDNGLEEGDAYSVNVYAPNPTREQMEES